MLSKPTRMYLGFPKLNLYNSLQNFKEIQTVWINGTKLVEQLVVWPSNSDVLLMMRCVAKHFVYSSNSHSLSQCCSLGIVVFTKFL